MVTLRTTSLSILSLMVAGLLAVPAPAMAQGADQNAANAADMGQTLDQMLTPPQGQQQANPQQQLVDMAFQSALDQSMPLNPEQIQQLIARMSTVQQAVAPAIQDPVRPTAEMKVDTISLDPAGQPPVIKVASGYVSTVMFVDATGAPWPIVDMAYAGKFEIKTAVGGDHMLRIIPMSRFQEGNMTVQLKNMATPVTFRIIAGNDTVYFRYDVRVPALGPNAKPPRFVSANSMVAGGEVMTSVLDGYPPAGAKRLRVSGLDDRTAAWDINGQTYLRTPHSLLSPAWSSSAASGDGTTVYIIPETPVLLLSDGGVMVRARLSRPEGFVSTGTGE